MKSFCRTCLFSLLVFLCVGDLRAQQQAIQFTRIDRTDGLAGNQINAIAQDLKGFMWFGTSAGLSRFDGYDFKNYKPGNTTSFWDNWVEVLVIDDSGSLWIGTGRGLNRYDPVTGAFTRYYPGSDTTARPENDITALLKSDEGDFWIGTQGGLFRFDPSSNTFEAFKHDPNDITSLSYDHVRVLFEDRAGVLWVGTGESITSPPSGRGGLNRFNRETGSFTRYSSVSDDTLSLMDNEVLSIFEDHTGVLWVGTRNNGLHQYNPSLDAFSRVGYLMDSSLSVSWSAQQALGWTTGVTLIFEDRNKTLWIGDFGHGLYQYNRTSNSFAYYRYNPRDPTSISDDDILSMFEDRTGVLWVGTRSGLNKWDRFDKRFRQITFEPGNPNSLSYSHVWSVWEDHLGLLWAGTTAGGLNRINRSAGEVAHFRHNDDDPTSIAHDNVNFLYEDGAGTLWVGTFGNGLDRYNRETETFTHYPHNPEDASSLSDSVVTAIVEDHTGTLWVGTRRGLNRLDRSTGKFKVYQSNSEDPQSLLGRGLTVLFVDRRGDLWVCSAGISKYDRENDNFTHLVKGSGCTSMHEDQRGRLWAGGGGLSKVNRSTGEITSYSVVEGLPSNAVRGILEDEEGFLWLSTVNGGISRFDPETETFRNYGLADGLQDIRFSWDAFHKSKSGELFFGGPAGVTAFFPDEVIDNPYPPELALTQLRVNGEIVHPGLEDPFHALLSDSDELRLPYDENSLAIDYVGMHYSQPKENVYAYRLEGLDADWREVGNLRRAEYASLPVGSYTFHVKAANSDGVWSEPISLKIAILPPWWRTIWAFLLYGLLFGVGLFNLNRYQHRRLIRKAREKARERELKHAKEIEEAYHQLEEAHANLKTTQQQLVQSEKMASLGQLTAGIAHELKNPLNFVNNFAQLNAELLDELRQNPDARIGDHIEAIEDARSNARQIAKHGRRADRIVQSMMQHASRSEGERYRVEVNPFVDEYVTVAYNGIKPRLQDLEVTIEREFDERVGAVKMAPQEMSRVLQNLLNNAFEAVHEKAAKVDGVYEPRVSVSTSRKEDGVEIRVCDNGSGIPDDIKGKIFEPFFTTKPPGSGTGLGLSLSYDVVVKGHGGSLTVESEEGKGAAFVIALPVGDASAA